MKGTVGCLVDPELISDKSAYTGGTGHYDPPLSTQFPPNSTPDTSFYQWVPFCLVLQVSFTVVNTSGVTSVTLGCNILSAKEDMEDM